MFLGVGRIKICLKEVTMLCFRQCKKSILGLATLLEGAGYTFFTVNLKVKIKSFLWSLKAVKLVFF